jgi:sporulation protein YlmC with PRC-barrel domain
MAKVKKPKIPIISTKLNDIIGISVHSLIGKKVVSRLGEPVGKITDIMFDSNNMQGVIVRKGMKKSFIDKEYFQFKKEDVLVLNIEPITLLIGKQVFDSKGEQIGKVVNIKRDNADNKFKALIVKKNLFKKPIEITPGQIDTTKVNILLNTTIDK